jgi:hypothetical protein
LSSNAFQPRKPRFKLGDHVLATVPTVYRDRQGIVLEVITPTAGDVYRYRVLFEDGGRETLFGFELEVTGGTSK